MIRRSSSAIYSGTGNRFVAKTGTGHEIVLDDDAGDTGARPVELLLVGQAGCTGFDVVGHLREAGLAVTRYEVTVTAEQRDEAQPAIYKKAIVLHKIEMPAPDEAVVRQAIYASATKYSSVTAMLSAGTVEVHHRYSITGPGAAAAIEGRVIVTGPRANPDRLDESAGAD
jgi:putative redox protein